jgi:magnesium transporter
MARDSRSKVKKVGMPPGSIVYTGEPRTEPINITVYDYTADRMEERTTVGLEECLDYKDKPSATWVDVDGVHDAKLVQRICEGYGVHPLTIEDIVTLGTRAKCEEYDDYLFIVLDMLECVERDGKLAIQGEQVSVVLGKNFVLTFQEAAGDVWEPIRKRIRTDGSRMRRSGSDYLAYALLDAVVDHYFLVLEQVGAVVEQMEETALDSIGPETVGEIHDLKRLLLKVRKAVWPLRDVTGILVRTESELIGPTTRPFLRDVHDHVMQAIDTNELYRESAVSLLELYLAGTSNRMNQVMKVLTVIATIFIPITFISSVYGMNFDYMPELHWKYGYFWALGLMAATAAGLIVYFRKNDWL